ncbi:MAG: PAS domain S-box protein [Methanobacteriota archaeon]
MTESKKKPNGQGANDAADAARRKKAEDACRAGAGEIPEEVSGLEPDEARRILHELRVHQIELEMQNEELRQAQENLEASQARYFDLYDLAPVGYLTISEKGLIVEANLTFATMLDVARGSLPKQPITKYILREDQDIYYRHRKAMFETGEPQFCEMRLAGRNGAPFWAHMEANIAEAPDGTPVCRVVVSDISERKLNEEARESLSRFPLENPNPVVRISAKGDILFSNSSATTLVDDFLASGKDEIPVELRERIDGALATGKVGFMEWVAEGIAYILTIAPVRERGYANLYAVDVTARKSAEKKLKNSMELYKDLVENINDVIFSVDAEGKITYISPPVKALAGYEPEELIGKTVFRFIHPDDRERVSEKFQRAVHSGSGILEYRILTKGGETRWVSGNSRPRMKDGRTVGFRGVLLDITKRNRAEEALAKSEAQYRLIAENMADTIWLMDLDLRVTYISPSVVKTRGYTLEELNDLPLDKQLTAESFEMMMKVLESEMTAERLAQKDLQVSHTFELEFYRKDGSTFWSEVTIKLLRDAGGSPTSMLGVGRDITERKLAREALVASEAKLRGITDSMLDMVCTVDPTGIITYASPSYKASLGYEPQSLMGGSIFDLVHPDDLDSVMEAVTVTKGTKSSGLMSFRYQKADGTYAWLESLGNILYDGDGNVSGAIFGSRDITDRMRAQEAMLREKTLESRYTLTKIMTDVVPALLTMGRGDKSKEEFMGEMMRRLEEAFFDKYFPTQGLGLEEFGANICALMNDMGGEFSHRADCGELHILGGGCPWKNDLTRNPILCMIDRGLIERFANKALGSVSLNQISSLVNGDAACEFVTSKVD